MKTIKLLGISVVTILASCGGNATSTKNSNDSTEVEDVIVEDSVTSTPGVLNTPDLSYAEVKGNVKEVANYDPDFGANNAYHFDTEGNLIKQDEYDGAVYTRNDKGEIISVEMFGEKTNLTWEDGYLKESETEESDGTLLAFLYIYNSKGYLIKTVVTSDGPEGKTSWTINYKYTEESFDETGNWIKRESYSSDTRQRTTEQRQITYY